MQVTMILEFKLAEVQLQPNLFVNATCEPFIECHTITIGFGHNNPWINSYEASPNQHIWVKGHLRVI